MERFDGFPVDKYLARMSGAFDLTPEEGDLLKYGETVVVVAVSTVGPATFNETRGGDIARTNVLKPRDVIVLPADKAESILLELGVPTQLSLDRPDDPRPQVDRPDDPGPGDIRPGMDVVPATAEDLDYDDEEEPEEVVVAAPSSGTRQYPTPSTVGASQRERDPMLAAFLSGGQ
jgi:hypothetical protein